MGYPVRKSAFTATRCLGSETEICLSECNESRGSTQPLPPGKGQRGPSDGPGLATGGFTVTETEGGRSIRRGQGQVFPSSSRLYMGVQPAASSTDKTLAAKRIRVLFIVIHSDSDR